MTPDEEEVDALAFQALCDRLADPDARGPVRELTIWEWILYAMDD